MQQCQILLGSAQLCGHQRDGHPWQTKATEKIHNILLIQRNEVRYSVMH